MKTFARLVDNKIAEYPVYEQHILNRAHPFSWYTECIYDEQPEVDEFHYAQEVLKVREGKVYISYEVKAQSLDALLSNLSDDHRPSFEQTPVDITTVPEATVNRIIELTKDHVQGILDTFAATKGYTNIISAASYLGSTNPAFVAEATTAVNLRDQTWLALYTYLEGVLVGTTPVPKRVSDIEAVLPALAWA